MKKAKDFFLALLIGLVLMFFFNHIVFSILENKRILLFKNSYILFETQVTDTYYGRGNFIAFQNNKNDTVIKESLNQIFYFEPNSYSIKIGDSILVAKFENGEYQIILRREWIKKYNIPIKPEQEKYIHMD